jgi:thiosulfate/3-mercaptopyruvate sulfurtransferase
MSDSPLVSTAWLREHLHDGNLRIVDIRGHVRPASEPLPHYFNHRADYDQSHIPGAVFVDWVHEITDPDDPRHAKIAKPERYAEVMRRIGVGPETFVVAYDDAQGMFAARLWWSLNYYGHTRVGVLDGGWQKWVAEGGPVTVDIPHVEPSKFEAHPNPALLRTGDEVLAKLDSASVVDVRTPQEFAGEASRAARKGHIPGAVNVPRTSLVAPDGTMLSKDDLRKKFAQAGVDDSQAEIITYCNSGVSSSYGLLALYVAGLGSGGSLYDGSWKDWGNDEAKPIA